MITRLAVSTVTVAVASALTVIPLTMPPVAAATEAPQKVIVLLRDQHPDLQSRFNTAQRADAVATDQSPILDTLRSGGATKLMPLNLVNAVAASASSAAVAKLRSDPRVAAVVPDLPVRRPSTNVPLRTAAPGTPCPADSGQPLLEPEAVGLTHTDVAQRSATGKGVKVAFFADGVDQDNPEFLRPDGSRVITEVADFTGDGTNDHTDGGEAFGDASAIAAQGSRTYDLATELPGSQAPKGCAFRIRGFAPDAELMSIKIFGENSGGMTSTIVRGIEYAVEHGGVDVLSQSFGTNFYPDVATDPINLANRAAIAAGVTVVASTGDAGPSGTIGSPASDPQVIAVGATTSLRLYAQAYGYSGWLNNNLAAFSSGGMTLGGRVPDLVAPGMMGMAACTPDPRWTGCTQQTEVMGGTSQSAPFVAGTAALVIEAYKRTHGGQRPAPDLVKRLLTGTAADLGTAADQQGAGLLDSDAAVRAALSYSVRGATGSTALVPSVGQLDITSKAGDSRRGAVTLTNTATQPQKVTMTSRAVAAQTFATDRTVTIGEPRDIGAREGPTATDPVTVSVPSGTPLLDATMVWQGTADSGKLTMVLVDPAGRLAQLSYDSGRGGYSNHQNVTVRDPQPGTWTVKIVWGTSILSQGPAPKPGSYRGPARLRVAGYGYTHDLTPQTRTVPAGGSVNFTATIPLPASAGDAPMSLQFDSDTGTHLSVPVARRSLIPADPRRTNTFTATVTGGVGWPGVSQNLGYHLDLPPGHHSLTIDLTAPDPGTQLVYYLVDPEQQILARDTNRTGDDGSVQTPEATLTVNDPAPGRWTLIIGLIDGVSGKDFSQQVSGRVRLDAASATAEGLPTSPRQIIKQGSSLTGSVRVPNIAAADRNLYLDSRLDGYEDRTIEPDGDKASVTAPGALTWWVPSHTTGIRATATAGSAVDLTLAPWTLSPQTLSARPGTTATVDTTARQLTPGGWTTIIERPGPYGATPAPTTTANLTLTSHTQAFDTAITAQSGEFWLPGPYTPVHTGQRETATIAFTIKPTEPVGTVVRGTIYVCSDSALGLGSELIGIPYAYTVG